MAKPVTEKIGEQIKQKQEEQAEKLIEQMQELPLPGPQIHALPAPKKKPTGYIADQDKGIDYHWIPDKYKKKYQNWLKSKTMRIDFMKARDMAATEARNYGNNARGIERRRLQNEETEEEKRVILTQKKISKNIIKILRRTTKQRGFLLQTNRGNRIPNKKASI